MFQQLRDWFKERRANRTPGPTIGGIICLVIVTGLITYATIKATAAGALTVKGIIMAFGFDAVFAGLTAYSIFRFINIRHHKEDD